MHLTHSDACVSTTDISPTCSPFLPGRPGRPWIPASPWKKTLTINFIVKYLMTHTRTTSEYSHYYLIQQPHTPASTHPQCKDHHTISSFMLIYSPPPPPTESHFIGLSQSHLLSFGSVAPTSPLGSSVTLETHIFISDRRTWGGFLWFIKRQKPPNQPARQPIFTELSTQAESLCMSTYCTHTVHRDLTQNRML